MFRSWSSCTTNGQPDGDPTLSCVFIVIQNLITALLIFVGVTALVMFIFGGYKYINSGGDPNKIDSARKNFTYGMLGLAIVLLSILIMDIIAWVTGVDCITRFSFTCN